VRPLRYSINVTTDGCCDHRVGVPDEATHRHATRTIERADALILGRVTYELMESAWRPPGMLAEMQKWMLPFGEKIDAAKKYVVSSTLEEVDWNAELIRGDLGEAVRALKDEPGEGLYVGGVTLPRALAEFGLIDEYEFLVQPRIVGHGPWLFEGLSEAIELELVGHEPIGSAAVAMRYVPRTG
jgi:dihydrofolate reductase